MIWLRHQPCSMHIGMPWCALDWAGGPLGSSAVNALCVYGFVCAEDDAGLFSALQCAEVSACMLLSGPVVAPGGRSLCSRHDSRWSRCSAVER